MKVKILIVSFLLNAFAGVGHSQNHSILKLSLEQAIDMALKNNEAVLISENNVRTARAQIREAWADALPDIRFTGLYTRNFKQPVFFFPDPATGEQRAFRIGSKNSYLMTLSVDQPLFQAGKVSRGIKAANYFKQFSNEGLESVKTDLAFQTKSAYYQVQLQQELLEINRQSLQQQRANLINTRKLFQQGQVAELDTLRAWVNYTNLQPRVISSENALETAKNRLKDIIGVDLHKPILLTDALTFEPVGQLQVDEVQQMALQERPEMQQLDLQSRILQQNVGITRADLFPKLFLNGTYQTVAQSDQYDFGRGFQSSISGSIRLEIPLFRGLRRFAKIQQAQIDYKNSIYQISQFRDQLLIEVKAAVLKIKEAEKRVQVQQSAIKQAERALFMSQKRYNEGVGTQLELDSALLALNITRSNYVQAVIDHKMALAELDKAIGRK